ncbi:hypothetical protein ACEUZ9_004694 [Paracoccus litorisediminis]|uniref:hypothetical protein n=1 Tax=Paracoccus litorisediminis TaxID=2006130 RepID=UPI0037339B3A
MILSHLAVFMIAPIAAAAAVSGVRRVSEGEDKLPLLPAHASAALGAAIGAGAFGFDLSLSQSLTLISLLAILGIGTYTDWRSGWAPDGLALSAVMLAMALGVVNGTWVLPLWAAVPVGIFVWLTANLTWLGLVRMIPALPPPADLLALVMPFLAFGIGIGFPASMIGISIVLAFCLFFPGIHRIFSREEVEEKAMQDLGSEIAGRGRPVVTFLAIAYPVFGVVALITACA